MSDYPIQAAAEKPLAGFEIGVQDGLLEYLPIAQKVISEVSAPVARVVLDLPLAHLNHFYEYSIPKRFADLRVGAKVKVDFGTQLVSGYVIERVDNSVLAGKLRPIRSVISNFPVLQPEIYRLAREISIFTATPIANILRLAIPSRNASIEKEYRERIAQMLEREHLLKRKTETNFAVFSEHLLASEDFSSRVVSFVSQQEHTDGVIVVLPTLEQAEKCVQNLGKVFPKDSIALISGGQEPRQRYEEFVRVLCGDARIVVGTRAAAWAPVKNLTTLIIADDSHAAFTERRAPYLPIREVLRLRGQVENSKLILLNQGPSIWGSFWAEETGSNSVQAELAQRKKETPQVYGLGELGVDDQPWHRLPASVFKVVRAGLEKGSVLIVVPKSGYIPIIACTNCGTRGKCRRCGHLLGIEEYRSGLHCGNCTQAYAEFNCLECGGQRYRALRIGSRRTAQEIGKAFPNQAIVIASPEHEVSEITGNKIVIALPGSEPEIKEKYAACVFLDAGYLLNSFKLDAEQQFLRIIAKSLAKVQTRETGGEALIVGSIPEELLNTLGRWDFLSWEKEQLQLRKELYLPPVATWFELTGALNHLEIINGFLKERLQGFDKQEQNLNQQDQGLEIATELNLTTFENSGGFGFTSEFFSGISFSAPYKVSAEKEINPRYRCIYRVAAKYLAIFSQELTAVIRQQELNTRENSVRLRINPETSGNHTEKM